MAEVLWKRRAQDDSVSWLLLVAVRFEGFYAFWCIVGNKGRCEVSDGAPSQKLGCCAGWA